MLKIQSLLINHKSQPINIDDSQPTFQWSIDSDQKNAVQTAYQLQVFQQDRLIFDTGKTLSQDCIAISYAGSPLENHKHYSVTLDVWYNTEHAHLESSFDTTFIDTSAWTAEWVSTGLPHNDGLPVFVKEFTINKPIKSAKIHSTAKGIYDIHVNNQQIHDDFLRPGWTNYKKRHQYQTYDVKKYLGIDDNIIEITVAPGWYVGNYGGDGLSNHYGNQLAATMELHITYDDDTTDIIITDKKWNWRASHILSSEIYHGEITDFTRKPDSLKPVQTTPVQSSLLISEDSSPVRIIKTFNAVDLIYTPQGETVIDFGQNLAGIVQLSLSTTQDQKITIKHAEVLDKEGNFYTENLRSAQATETYICNAGEYILRPRFTFHGFRYISVSGIEKLDITNFKALALSTDMKETATFKCSNELVNQLWSNIKWGMNSNFVDIPTDCPQRDERLGWTGDASAFIQTAGQLKDTYSLFSRWLKDLKSEQTKEYGVPHVVPNILGDHGGAALWSDSATIIPWTLYTLYGDKTVLQTQYDSMKDWVETMRATETELHLRKSGHQYGDWLALDKEESSSRPMGATDPYLIASIFYAYSTKILHQTASVLGYSDDEKEYLSLYNEIISGIQTEFITSTGRLVSETQTACVLVLLFDIAKPEHVPVIKETLINNINAHSGHITTGFIGTPYICHALSKVGASDIAGKLLLKEDYPSWLQEVKLGATTIWERWNSMLPDGSFDESGMNSFNHYAFGSIGSWMIEQLAGIRTSEPGYKSSIIAPQLIEGITHVEASRTTPYGVLSCAWKCENNRITVDITIPANTTSSVHLPEKEESINLGSGQYHFDYPTTTNLEPKRFTMDTKIKELLASDTAKSIFEKYVPNGSSMLTNFLADKTLNQLISMNPNNNSENFYNQLLDELNQL